MNIFLKWILGEILLFRVPDVGAFVRAWGVCVCVVRSDMSQLCSCSPLAQTSGCPRRLRFSSDETNLIPFLTAWGLLQDVPGELRQAKWGSWIQVATQPRNALWLPSSRKPFAVTSIPSGLNGRGFICALLAA